MRLRSPASTCPVLAALALSAIVAEPAASQYDRRMTAGLQDLKWENNRMRLSHLSVAPGETLPAGGNRILVYLTADPDGKLPAEAVWQSAGAGEIRNRGSVRLEAIAIELKDVTPDVGGGTPPEALAAPYGTDVSPLIDNGRVLVTKHRYAPNTYAGPLHFHPEDELVVYLRGGYTWPAAGYWGVYRVRRGDVEIIPANTFHRLGNAGSDPLELLLITPR